MLVVHALDRMGRSLPHLVKIMSTVTEPNITLAGYRENFDLSTAQSRMLAGRLSVLTDCELNMARERTQAGLRAAKARGSQVGNRNRLFDKANASELRDQGLGQIEIARAPLIKTRSAYYLGGESRGRFVISPRYSIVLTLSRRQRCRCRWRPWGTGVFKARRRLRLCRSGPQIAYSVHEECLARSYVAARLGLTRTSGRS